MRKGQFEAGVYYQNSLHPEYGRLVVADFDQAHIGLDFRKSVFTWGAAQLNAPRQGTGIVFSEGRGGEIYSGPRQEGAAQDQSWLTMRMGSEGFRIMSADGASEILAIDARGGIYLNGDVYVAGQKPTAFDRIARWLNKIVFSR